MNDRTISITVHTNDVAALTRAADMLHGLAIDCNNGGVAAPESIPRGVEVVMPEAPVTATVTPDAGVVVTTAPPPPTQTLDVEVSPNLDGGYTTPTGVELDAEGMPHDARIHSGTKNKTKEGVWKKTRGVDKQLVIDVTAELKAAMAAPTPVVERMPKATKPAPLTVVETPAPPAPPVQVIATYTLNGKAFTETELLQAGWKPDDIAGLIPDAVPVPTNASVQPITSAPQTEPVANGLTFPQIMGKVTNALSAGTITDAQVLTALNAQGLASIVLLSARPDLIDAVHMAIFPNG